MSKTPGQIAWDALPDYKGGKLLDHYEPVLDQPYGRPLHFRSLGSVGTLNVLAGDDGSVRCDLINLDEPPPVYLT